MKNIPKIKQCIKYIEGCGWKYQFYNKPWYVFKRKTSFIIPYPTEITFTLTEIRKSYKNGW